MKKGQDDGYLTTSQLSGDEFTPGYGVSLVY